jgi:hypothetical protein
MDPTGESHSFDQDHVWHGQRRQADKDNLDHARIERSILQKMPSGRRSQPHPDHGQQGDQAEEAPGIAPGIAERAEDVARTVHATKEQGEG